MIQSTSFCTSPSRPGTLIAGLLAILFASPVLAAQLPLPPELDGLWRVADSACSGCDPSQGAETGAELRLAARGTRNPFGTDCDGALEVEAQVDEPVAVVQERLGLPPRWLAGAETAPARAWRLWCEGRPAETVILLANGDLLLPGEASSVLHFQRLR